MKDEPVFNPDMLRLAREAREMTQSELAKAAGVTQALVSKLEHGLIAQPSDEVTEGFAHALSFPVAYFHQRDRAIGLPAYHQRQRLKLAAKPLARIGAVINIRRQHVLRLMRSYETDIAKPIPQIDLIESGLTPEKVAERLRAYWLLPRGPVPSVVDTIEHAGGIVVLTGFNTALLQGISFRSEGLPPLFFMNRDVSGDEFRYALARELGHLVMHTVPEDDAVMEEQARRFAAAFLMPAADIKPYLIEPKLSSLGRVKAFWKVSIRALIERARDLNLVTEHQYKALGTQYAKAFKNGEPHEIEPERPWRLAEVVRYHREELGYSLADLAKLLVAREQDIERAYLPKSPGLRLVVSN